LWLWLWTLSADFALVFYYWSVSVTASADMHHLLQICGIGKVSEKMLAALGIVTCSQLHEQRDILYHLYSPSSFEHFMQISLGIGSTHVERFFVVPVSGVQLSTP